MNHRGLRKASNLIHRGSRKELAVEVGGHDDSSGSVWILGRDDIGKCLSSVWRVIFKLVFLDMPVQDTQRRDKVIPDKGIIVRVSWRRVQDELASEDATGGLTHELLGSESCKDASGGHGDRYASAGLVSSQGRQFPPPTTC
jgi:hypothetical protein